MIEVDSKVLHQQMLDARARTLMLVSDLTDAQLMGPRLSIVNPPLWEIGHLAWFQERWCLRHDEGHPQLRSSARADADALYDSSSVPHDTRWDLPLPSLDETLDYLQNVLERVLERLDAHPSRSLLYFAQLAALHEEMHCEAFTYTRQTLSYPAPRAGGRPLCHSEVLAGDAQVEGGTFMLGAVPSDGFVFDNEKWAHRVEIGSFRIARTCVTNAEFAAFVEDGGYSRAELWCTEGLAWRCAANAAHPVYWHKDGDSWRVRVFDESLPLFADSPVIHVNWYEANAYCRWAGRRLPSEAEWEYAASTGPERAPKRRYPWGEGQPDANHANLYGSAGQAVRVDAYAPGDSAWGCRQMIGNVWEWTADAFHAFPGFVADPYKEYSEPWFGDHKVLRGGCFATRGNLIRNTWRNFYTPERRDVFAGFRTCA